MGIFSSKYKTTVGTSITRVIEDDNLPNSARSGITRSIMTNDDQLVENVLENLATSVGVRAERMFTYGKDKYPHGLPTDNFISTKSGEEILKDILEDQYGPITIDYHHFGPLNNLHYGWLKLQNDYLYNPTTNTLIHNGMEGYLENMVVVVQEATFTELENGSLNQWGRSPQAGKTHVRPDTGSTAGHSPFETDAAATGDYLRVTYTRQELTGAVTVFAFNIPISGMDVAADYHHVKLVANGATKYWLYRSGQGAYTGLDAAHETEHNDAGTYFPWAYFRYNKQSTVKDTTTAEFKSSARMVDFLGMDYESVGTAINENPDIADVEQAIMMMAVPANSTNQTDITYLYDFFNSLYQRSGGMLNKPLARIGNIPWMLKGVMEKIDQGMQAIVIQDKKFKLSLSFQRISKKKYPSNAIGKVGTHQGGYGEEIVESGGLDENGNPIMLRSGVKYHYYRRQVSPNVVEEIRIDGLTLKYHIFEGYYETADENEDILLIPLDKSITDNYSIPMREVLYARSLHYVFNSRIITKIKWYQRGAFKYLMMIIAIVITLWTGPGGGALWAAISAGTAAAVVVALISVIVEFIINMLVAMVLKLFVKLVGGKFALILAMVVALYTGYISFQAGSFSGAPFATELLSLSTGLVKAGYEDVMLDEFNDLKAEYEEFSNMVETNKEKLERAKSELSYNNYLTPEIIFGETPTEFYERTVHSGNIGVLGLDAISSYIDIALTLPKLPNTA